MDTRPLAAFFALGAAASLAWAYLQGQLRVALVLVFPVLYGSGPWMLLGIFLLMAAFAAWAFGGMPRAPPWEPRSGEVEAPSEPATSRPLVSGGGLVMLGPIPIVFGSDRRWVLLLMALAVVLMLLWVAAAWVVG